MSESIYKSVEEYTWELRRERWKNISSDAWKEWLSDENYLSGVCSQSSPEAVYRVVRGLKPIAWIETEENIALAAKLNLHVVRSSEYESCAEIYLEPNKTVSEFFPPTAIEEMCLHYEPVVPGISKFIKSIYYNIFAQSPISEVGNRIPYQTEMSWENVSKVERYAYHCFWGLLLGYNIHGTKYSTVEYLKRQFPKR